MKKLLFIFLIAGMIFVAGLWTFSFVSAKDSLGCTFIRGDANRDGRVDIYDAVFVLNYIFVYGQQPTCLDAADANDDGSINIVDPVFLLMNLFGGSGPLKEPFMFSGADPTRDSLTCGKISDSVCASSIIKENPRCPEGLVSGTCRVGLVVVIGDGKTHSCGFGDFVSDKPCEYLAFPTNKFVKDDASIRGLQTDIAVCYASDPRMCGTSEPNYPLTFPIASANTLDTKADVATYSGSDSVKKKIGSVVVWQRFSGEDSKGKTSKIYMCSLEGAGEPSECENRKIEIGTAYNPIIKYSATLDELIVSFEDDYEISVCAVRYDEKTGKISCNPDITGFRAAKSESDLAYAVISGGEKGDALLYKDGISGQERLLTCTIRKTGNMLSCDDKYVSEDLAIGSVVGTGDAVSTGTDAVVDNFVTYAIGKNVYLNEMVVAFGNGLRGKLSYSPTIFYSGSRTAVLDTRVIYIAVKDINSMSRMANLGAYTESNAIWIAEISIGAIKKAKENGGAIIPDRIYRANLGSYLDSNGAPVYCNDAKKSCTALGKDLGQGKSEFNLCGLDWLIGGKVGDRPLCLTQEI